MMQIVHDVAPGAKLAFHTAVESEADFANGIQALVNAGAQVIADDVTYFDEPFFQDGLLAQAANGANAAGVAYFSAAGNSGSNGYDNPAPDFSTAAVSPAGEQVLNFDTTGATTATALTVNLPAARAGGVRQHHPAVGSALRHRRPQQRRRHEPDGSVRGQSDRGRPDRKSGQPGPGQPEPDQ